MSRMYAALIVALGMVPLLLSTASGVRAQVAVPRVAVAGIAAGNAQAPASPQQATGTAWVLRVDPAASAARLEPALLGMYDIDGTDSHLDQFPNLEPAMHAAGVSEWRIGLGRWELGTHCLPPTGPWDSRSLDKLLLDRDWFVDHDGAPVTLTDTLDDSRYSLGYVNSVIDCALRLGAQPWVDIDLMPRALAQNRDLRRDESAQGWWYTFANGVSNSPPASPAVFAAAVEGVVKRIVEGVGLQPGRPVRYFELWNEPDLGYAWDRSLDPTMGRFFQMVGMTLTRLAEYRRASPSPRVRALRFGLGSFAGAEAAVRALEGFDAAGGNIPLDFISFHGYSDDPLDIVEAIRKVAAARATTRHYRHVELALTEWGRDLDPGKLAQPQDPMQGALHAATVIAMGAALGLTHAHRSTLWDLPPPFPGIGTGFLDHSGSPRTVATAYALLSRVIRPGAFRLPVDGAPSGSLDGGNGACLVARVGNGLRAILVNRDAKPRPAWILVGDHPVLPRTLTILADQGQLSKAHARPDGGFAVPARSVVLAEL